MVEPAPLPGPPLHHPDRMRRDDSVLLVVDAQQKLLPVVRDHRRIVWNLERLCQGARLLGVPVMASEQYPQGLGATAAELLPLIGTKVTKISFSCAGATGFREQMAALQRPKILIAGIETHVCVQQTALDLLTEGYLVQVAVDAVSTRHAIDNDVALRRMESQGVTLTTTEAALFEWCDTAGTAEFKKLSALVRQTPPQ